MKLLLDENLPRKLIRDLEGHEAYTVAQMGWSGKSNGDLLAAMLQTEFDVLLTADKNLQHQQNFERYTIPVLVFNSLFITYGHLSRLVPQALRLLQTALPPGPTLVDG